MAGEATVSGGSLQSNKVSVVITTVGHPGLARAVHSALSQTLPPLQVIVVDDRVASETPDLDLALSDPRVVVTRTFGGGANHARNRGIHLASGEVIALLDDDDFWFANKLERQLTTLLGSQELDRTLVTCQAYMESARAIYPKRPFADGDLADYLFCRHFPHIRFDSFVQTSSLMFARSLALRLPFREGLSSHQDWDWLLSLRAASVSFVTLPEPLYFYSAPSPGGISAAARPAAGYQWAMHALPEGSAALFGYGSIIAVPRALRARDYGFARAAIRYSLRHGQFHGWTALMGIAYSVLSLSRPQQPAPGPTTPAVLSLGEKFERRAYTSRGPLRTVDLKAMDKGHSWPTWLQSALDDQKLADAEVDDSELARGHGVAYVGRRLAHSLTEDTRLAFWHFLLNSCAGSAIMPRAARYLIYRSLGLDVRTPKISYGVTFTDRNITINPGTFVNHGVMFEPGPIEIGSDCQIGFGAKIITSTHGYKPDGTLQADAHQLPVKIGHRCWIGAGAIILPNVTICDDVTVAAGAVVTKSIDQPGLYAGVPAVYKRGLQPAKEETSHAALSG